MAHHVIEAFCEGKYRDVRDEDRLFVGCRQAAAVLSFSHREIWRVGDCPFAFDRA